MRPMSDLTFRVPALVVAKSTTCTPFIAAAPCPAGAENAAAGGNARQLQRFEGRPPSACCDGAAHGVLARARQAIDELGGRRHGSTAPHGGAYRPPPSLMRAFRHVSCRMHGRLGAAQIGLGRRSGTVGHTGGAPPLLCPLIRPASSEANLHGKRQQQLEDLQGGVVVVVVGVIVCAGPGMARGVRWLCGSRHYPRATGTCGPVCAPAVVPRRAAWLTGTEGGTRRDRGNEGGEQAGEGDGPHLAAREPVPRGIHATARLWRHNIIVQPEFRC